MAQGELDANKAVITLFLYICSTLTASPSSQLIINTAIVYMHRFYMIHSFTKFHRNVSTNTLLAHAADATRCKNQLVFPLQIISQTTLFLAAKVEEQPRKLEHVVKIAHACINPQEPALDTKSNVSTGWNQNWVFPLLNVLLVPGRGSQVPMYLI